MYLFLGRIFLFACCIGYVSALSADGPEWGDAAGGLQLTASVSAKEIRSGEALSLNVSMRNISDKSIKVLPLQKSEWSRFFVSIDKTPTVDRYQNPYNPTLVLGTLPELVGLNSVIPLELRPGKSVDATVSLLSSDFFIRTVDMVESRPLFSFPGRFHFKVQYEIDETAAKAFGVDMVKIKSPNIEVAVVGEQGPNLKLLDKGDGLTWIDLDGKEQPKPKTKRKILPEERKKIEETFFAKMDENRKEYASTTDFDPNLGIIMSLNLEDSGWVEFCAGGTYDEWQFLLASPKELQALRKRMMKLESALLKAGIDAHASGVHAGRREADGL